MSSETILSFCEVDQKNSLQIQAERSYNRPQFYSHFN